VQVSYSTGKSGSRLAWLPYRPTAGELRSRQNRDVVRRDVIQVDFEASATPSQTTGGGSPSDDPMSDPFGDLNPSATKPPTTSADTKPFAPSFIDPTTLPDNGDSATAQNTTTRRVPPSEMPESLIEGGLGKPSGESSEPQPLPSLEEELAKNAASSDGCPETSGFKPINQLTTDVRASSGDFPRECGLKEDTYTPRVWTPTTFTWKASGLCHKPLYFEQIQVERYGHSFGPYVQPWLSHAHFFVTVPMLPYLMGVYPPNECMYTLGYYRPGSCAPYMLDPLPISVRGALWEAGAWTGAAFLIP